MAVSMTINRSVNSATNQLMIGGYWLQHTLMYTSAAGWNAAMDLLANVCTWHAVHMGGGYANSATGAQAWAQTDVAPNSSTRQWTTPSGSSRDGLDSYDARFATIKTKNAGSKFALVAHDFFQQTQDPTKTRSSATGNNFFPPNTSQRRTDFATIIGEILNHYPGRYSAVSIGQEFKGWDRYNANNAAPLAMGEFVDHANKIATYIRANFPTVEIWFPHLNYVATSAEPSRTNVVDGWVANTGGFLAADLTTLQYCLDNMPPSLVDRITYDISICDNNTASPRSTAFIQSRTSIERGLTKAINDLQLARPNWGVKKPLVAIETYVNVNLSDNGRHTDDELGVFGTSMVAWAGFGGTTIHMRWQPEGDIGTPYNRQSFFSKTGNTTQTNPVTTGVSGGTPYPLYYGVKDFKEMFPPGTTFKSVTTSNSLVEGWANATEILLLNKTANSETITLTDATTSATKVVTVAAFKMLRTTLPISGGGSGGTGWTFVKAVTHNSNGAGLTNTASLSGTSAAGNILVAVAAISNNAGIVNFVDPAGWQVLPTADSGATGPKIKMWAKVSTGEQSLTTTYTSDPSNPAPITNIFSTLHLREYTAATNSVVPHKSANTAQTATFQILDTGTITTTLDGCLVIGGVVNKNSDLQTEGGDGFTPAGIDSGNGGVASNQRINLEVYELIQAAAGVAQETPTLPAAVSRQYAGAIAAIAPTRAAWVKTGQGTTGALNGSGAKIRQNSKQNIAIMNSAVASGAKIRQKVPKQNIGIIGSTTGSGAKVYVPGIIPGQTYTKTGIAISVRTASGAKVYLQGQTPTVFYTKTGVGAAVGVGSGPSVVLTGQNPTTVYTKTGSGKGVGVSSGAKIAIQGNAPTTFHVKVNATITLNAVGGSDIFTSEVFTSGGIRQFNKTGRVVSSHGASGRKVST